jgi:2-oxoisovalerate dehydrogenase E1 component
MSKKQFIDPVAESKDISFEEFRKEVLNDYRIAVISRQASLLGRKEVLRGKAKFGIFGDGKEIAQIAMAKAFKNGDWRSGYYRDQTFMLALGETTVQQFFAQLYAHPDEEAEPCSAGRSMNGHFASRSLRPDGTWKNLTAMKNSAADIAPTGAQMPRLVGLAFASKLYRDNKDLHTLTDFSINGNEVAFGTIGDASTSEGVFMEAINAAGVLQIPMAISVWDDGYGISVSSKLQTTKQSISAALKGFEKDENGDGILIYKGKGWDYSGLNEMYEKGIAECRKNHIPVLFHIQEMTQPLGHSTSGSHERYKSKERLNWEAEYDCIKKMKEWILANSIGKQKELNAIDHEAILHVKESMQMAWEEYCKPIKKELDEVLALFDEIAESSTNTGFIHKIRADLAITIDPVRKDIITHVKKVLRLIRNENMPAKKKLLEWDKQSNISNAIRYDSHQYNESDKKAIAVKGIPPTYASDAPMVDGREILLANFDYILKNDKRVCAFGEDVGKIGGVNQTYAGLQEKYGALRVFDTGIREATIMGQAIGMALRGLRPIAEIQYLDYFGYAIQILSDDLSSLQYRTKGGQTAPVIISTRGHRLEGMFHAGSPLGMIINGIRGIYVITPRNMTQAAGFYNTMLASDDPALIIEPLNGYRLKEKIPSNIGEYRIPLGVPEVICEGTDITIVTYGSCCKIAIEAARHLLEMDISCEIIDVQTLLPFDVNHAIVNSLKKTNKILFFDEDVPGGASSFMMQKVLEEQKGYFYLDSAPKTLTAKEHRTAYGSDGDYFSKPSAENVFDTVYAMMSEIKPDKYPPIY